MNEQYPRIPDAETRKRLLANLRQTRLDLQEFGLQLEEVEALLDRDIRQQKMKRLQKKREYLTKII